MKRFSHSKICLLAFTALCGVALSSPSQAKDPELAFYPAKDWSISEGSSCTAANEFNNGFIIQLDGGANGIQAMTVNVRQDAFEAGKSYNTGLSVPGASKTSTGSVADNAQILTINMNGKDSLYQQMRGAGVFDLTIDENKFRFYMVGFANAGAAFETCMAGLANNSGAQHSSAAPAAAEQAASAPQDIVVSAGGADNINWQDQSAPVDITQPVIEPQKVIFQMKGNDKTGLDYLGIPEDSPIEVTRETASVSADFSAIGNETERLKLENQQLRDELEAALAEARQEQMSIKGENWNMEKSAMMYNESERQVQLLGQKLQRERTACDMEKKELEAMLFDPQVTNEQQMAKLADLEAQLAKAKDELNMQRVRYDDRIRVLEGQIQTQ